MGDSTNNRLARLRRAEGMSKEAVAAMLGVDITEVARWEQGAAIPAAARVALAERFGVDPESLVTLPALPTEAVRMRPAPARRFARRARQNRLSRLRQAEGLSVAALAAELGVDAMAVDAWEGGANIPEQQVALLTARFGVTSDRLLGREALPTDVIPFDGNDSADAV
jgi:transcriptional regulator with XRE-family HTH domain